MPVFIVDSFVIHKHFVADMPYVHTYTPPNIHESENVYRGG